METLVKAGLGILATLTFLLSASGCGSSSSGPSRCDGVTCSASDQCHLPGVCDPATGSCSNPAKANGATCDDANGCTVADACLAGACAGGASRACPATDQCHVAGVCEIATGTCTNPPKVDGASCDDVNACSTVDSCRAGTCVGGGFVSCADPGPCLEAGTCGPSTGTCAYVPKPDGTPCTIASASPGTCKTGICTEGTQAFGYTAEADRRVEAIVPPEGGTVAASSSSGVGYSLEVPEGALDAPMHLTVTPVTSFTGLPVSGPLVAAVHFEPNGLGFFRPARVRVPGIAAGGGARLRAFVISDDGGTVDQVPFEVSGIDLVIPLAHFSNVAVFGGAAVETAWCSGTASFEQWLAALPDWTTPANRAQGVVATLQAWLNDCNPADDPSGFPSYQYVAQQYVSEMWLWHRDIIARLDRDTVNTGHYSDPDLAEFNLWRNQSLSRGWQELLVAANHDDTVFDPMAELGYAKIGQLLEARFASHELTCINSGAQAYDWGTWNDIYAACNYEGSSDPIAGRVLFGEASKLMSLKRCGTVGLELEPRDTTLAPGLTAQLWVNRIAWDGTRIPEARASMTVPMPIHWDAMGPPSSPSPVAVDQFGRVTATSVGEATVHAAHFGPGGVKLLSTSVPVVVKDLAIDVQPAALALRRGEPASLHATFKDASTQPSCEFQWLSSNVGVATAAGQPAGAPDAEVTASSSGTANITAVCGDAIGLAKVVVYSAIRVTPELACVGVGGTTQLSAFALDMAVSASVAWTASPEIVSIVDGTTTGLAEGRTVVTAKLGGGTDALSATARLLVTPVPICGTWDLFFTEYGLQPKAYTRFFRRVVDLQPDWAVPGQFVAEVVSLFGGRFPVVVSGDSVSWSTIYWDEAVWICEDFLGALTPTGEVTGRSEWTWHDTADCTSESTGSGFSVYGGFLR